MSKKPSLNKERISDSEKGEDQFKPTPEFKKLAHISSYSQYKSIYEFSINDPERFWSNEANELKWFKPWKEIKKGKASNTKWFVGGKTNISFNCIDRHLDTARKNKAAIIWESENSETKIITYQLLHTQVSKLANILKDAGISKGDHVFIYMGLIPEVIIALLACTRIGAIYSIIYSGLSSNALKKRIDLVECKLIFTQDYILKKGNKINLKVNVDSAIVENSTVNKVIVFKRFESTDITLDKNIDILWQDIIESASNDCEPVQLDSQHPIFCMFTNKSDGELLKINHLTGGYMVQSYLSSNWIYDLKENDIFWSSSDLAWIHAQTYGIFGALLNGVTTFLYEGVPVYPEADRYWQLISKFRINIFITNPTTLRALLKLGNEWVLKHNLSSLRLIGTTGEPIKPETWNWFYNLIGKANCPIVNSLVQTETGSIILSPFPGMSYMQPGLLSSPFPGTEIEIVHLDGTPVKTGEGGYLVLKNNIPSMFSVDTNDNPESKNRYWEKFNNCYFTGDAAIKEKNGFIKILGRVDDIIKAAGNRVCGTEIEKELLWHDAVGQAAIVKRPDEIITDALIAFIKLKPEIVETPLLREELRNFIAERIGSLAKPDELKILVDMPITDDGKIDRRKLRMIALEGTPPMSKDEEKQFLILEQLREDFQKKYLN